MENDPDAASSKPKFKEVMTITEFANAVSDYIKLSYQTDLKLLELVKSQHKDIMYCQIAVLLMILVVVMLMWR